MEGSLRHAGGSNKNRSQDRYPGNRHRRSLRASAHSNRGIPRNLNEVAFVEMKPADGEYEPLIGYILLEQSLAAVDPHRLIPIRHMDLKQITRSLNRHFMGDSQLCG